MNHKNYLSEAEECMRYYMQSGIVKSVTLYSIVSQQIKER